MRIFIFDSWFYSNKLAESVMEVGTDLVGMVKTNTKGNCKETVEKLSKYWSGGYYLVLKSRHMVPGGRPLISFGYRHNTQKVLFFIVTQNTGSANSGLPYLSKYSD